MPCGGTAAGVGEVGLLDAKDAACGNCIACAKVKANFVLTNGKAFCLPKEEICPPFSAQAPQVACLLHHHTVIEQFAPP